VEATKNILCWEERCWWYQKDGLSIQTPFRSITHLLLLGPNGWVRWPDGTEVSLYDYREEDWRHMSDDFEVVNMPDDYDGN
jgi:hypothetical protein